VQVHVVGRAQKQLRFREVTQNSLSVITVPCMDYRSEQNFESIASIRHLQCSKVLCMTLVLYRTLNNSSADGMSTPAFNLLTASRFKQLPVASGAPFPCHKLPATDMYPRITKLIFDEWQVVWNCCAGNKLHAIIFTVGGYKQKTCLSRCDSVLLSRLHIVLVILV